LGVWKNMDLQIWDMGREGNMTMTVLKGYNSAILVHRNNYCLKYHVFELVYMSPMEAAALHILQQFNGNSNVMWTLHHFLGWIVDILHSS
jgi:hypothetical protein